MPKMLPFSLPSSVIKWFHKKWPILILFWKMHADMSQYYLRKLFWMKLKTSKSHLTEKNKQTLRPTNYIFSFHTLPLLPFNFNILENNEILSVQFSCSVMSKSLQSHGLHHTRLPCQSPTTRAYSNSCPLSRWCHPAISSSVVPFSSHLQSFPASGSFLRSQFFASGGQIIRVSASASVSPMNIQDWFSLGWTGLISLQSKGLSRVFSNTIVQKHQFFGTQLSSQPNSHIHTWRLEKP